MVAKIPLAVCGLLPTLALAQVRVIGLGAYFNNIGSIDLVGAQFFGDFLLFPYVHGAKFASVAEASGWALQADGVSCREDFLNNATVLESVDEARTFVNMRLMGSNVRTIRRTTSNTPAHYRVAANFFFTTSLLDWPFDTQSLDVIVEDVEGRSDGGVHTLFCNLDRHTAISPHIRFPGVNGRNLNLTLEAATLNVCSPPFSDVAAEAYLSDTEAKESFDDAEQVCTNAANRYRVSLSYSRPILETLVKTVMPPFFLLLVTMGSYFFPLPDYGARFGVCSAGLTGAIMFHVNLVNLVPPSPQATRADALMFSVYFANLVAWLVTLITMNLFIYEKDDATSQEFARMLHSDFRSLGPATTLICGVLGIAAPAGYWWVAEAVVIGVWAVFLVVKGRIVLRPGGVLHRKWWPKLYRKKNKSSKNSSPDQSVSDCGGPKSAAQGATRDGAGHDSA